MILAIQIITVWLALNIAFAARLIWLAYQRERRERRAELDLIDNVIPLRRRS